MNACKYQDCSREHYAKGLCNLHYQREHRGVFSADDFARRQNGSAAKRDGQGRKLCISCDEWLDPQLFATHRATSDRLQVICRPCARLGQYHVTPARLKEMLEAQDHKCGICRASISGRFTIDHDHSCCSGASSCGKCVRGLLCDACNHGLGSFRDNPASLLSAINYLDRSQLTPINP